MCEWQDLPSLSCEGESVSSQWRACHTSQEDLRSNPPKPLGQWARVTPLLEAETGVLRQNKERLFSFRETHLMYMLVFVSSVILQRHVCWRSGHLGGASERYWAGETAQSVKCSLCKHEDPRSVIRTQIRKLHITGWHMPIIPSLMVGNTWILGDSLASQHSKISELNSRLSDSHVSGTKRSGWRRQPRLYLASTCIHTPVHLHTVTSTCNLYIPVFLQMNEEACGVT